MSLSKLSQGEWRRRKWMLIACPCHGPKSLASGLPWVNLFNSQPSNGDGWRHNRDLQIQSSRCWHYALTTEQKTLSSVMSFTEESVESALGSPLPNQPEWVVDWLMAQRRDMRKWDISSLENLWNDPCSSVCPHSLGSRGTILPLQKPEPLPPGPPMANLSPIWWLAHQCACWEHTSLIGHRPYGKGVWETKWRRASLGTEIFFKRW